MTTSLVETSVETSAPEAPVAPAKGAQKQKKTITVGEFEFTAKVNLTDVKTGWTMKRLNAFGRTANIAAGGNYGPWLKSYLRSVHKLFSTVVGGNQGNLYVEALREVAKSFTGEALKVWADNKLSTVIAEYSAKIKETIADETAAAKKVEDYTKTQRRHYVAISRLTAENLTAIADDVHDLMESGCLDASNKHVPSGGVHSGNLIKILNGEIARDVSGKRFGKMVNTFAS